MPLLILLCLWLTNNAYFCHEQNEKIMKKPLLLSVAFVLALFFSVSGQVSLSIGDVERGEGNVFVPVTVDFSSGVCAFDLYVNFDDSVLEFTGIANVASLPGDMVQANAVGPAQAHISWFDLGDEGTEFTGELLYLAFENHGGNSAVVFDATTEIGDCDGMALPPALVTLSDGSVTTVPVPLTRWALIIGAGLIVVFVALRAGRVI